LICAACGPRICSAFVYIRVAITCAKCDTELRDATFEIHTEPFADFAAIKQHHQSNGHSLYVVARSGEMISRSSKGTSFYGYSLEIDLSCECQQNENESLTSKIVTDEIRSSAMRRVGA